MKNFLSVLLTVALLFSLAACGKDSTSSQGGDKTSSEPSASSNSVASNAASVSTKPPMTNLPSTTYPTASPTDPDAPRFSAFSEDVYTHQIVRYSFNKECKGYYATPKAKGKYPTVIIMHGQGTVEKFKTRLLTHINNWVKAGYIPPMVVVIPEIIDIAGDGSDMQDFQYYISSEYPNRFNTLLTSIEEGTLSSQIGTDKPIYVTGFSMGGMAAVHAGVEYNTRIKYVGGLSPARAFYLGEGDNLGFYKYAKDIYFSQEPDAHVYLGAGRGEQNNEFVYTINRYERAVTANTPNIVTKYVAPTSWGDHSWELAQKEIFMYLYFATCGELPSEALVETVCSDPNGYKGPTVVYTEEEHTS